MEPVLSPMVASSDVNSVKMPLTSTDTQATTAPTQPKARAGSVKRVEDDVQAYVNRMLKRVVEPADATVDLTSQSFRRGRVQQANGMTALLPSGSRRVGYDEDQQGIRLHHEHGAQRQEGGAAGTLTTRLWSSTSQRWIVLARSGLAACRPSLQLLHRPQPTTAKHKHQGSQCTHGEPRPVLSAVEGALALCSNRHAHRDLLARCRHLDR